MHRLRLALNRLLKISLMAIMVGLTSACDSPRQHPPEPLLKPTSTPNPQPAPAEVPFTPPVPTHTVAEALQFLDSIGRRDWRVLDDSVKLPAVPKPGFRKDKYLNTQQFSELKAACPEGNISHELARFLIPNRLDVLDARDLEGKDSFSIQYHPLTKGEKFGYYAIVVNTDGWWGEDWVAFFERNHLVETHKIYYRYALNTGMFVDSSGRRFLWYNNEHGSGAGVSQFHLTFYCWEKSGFVPALEILEIGNMSYPPRRYGLDGKVYKTDPLAIQFKYVQDLPDPNVPELQSFPGVRIVEDSAIVEFAYDTVAHCFKGDWSASKLSYPQMLTYANDDNDLLFIQTHHKILRRLLLRGNEVQQRATRYYLSKIMDGNYPKNHDKR